MSATVLEPEADENEPPVLLLRLLLGGSIARGAGSSSSQPAATAPPERSRSSSRLLMPTFGEPQVPEWEHIPNMDIPRLHTDARFLFLLSAVLSALAAAHKRRCLSRRPVDLLILNTSLSALQLLVGLLLTPPLLLMLYGKPIKDTLVQLARGLRCFMSGFNPTICTENRDAFGVSRLCLSLSLNTPLSSHV